MGGSLTLSGSDCEILAGSEKLEPSPLVSQSFELVFHSCSDQCTSHRNLGNSNAFSDVFTALQFVSPVQS
jgi:hypothetical protein